MCLEEIQLLFHKGKSVLWMGCQYIQSFISYRDFESSCLKCTRNDPHVGRLLSEDFDIV